MKQTKCPLIISIVLKTLTRYLAGRFYKPLLVKWLSRERIYLYEGIRLRIHPEVFHPGFFFSTRILLKYLSGFSLHGKTLLELGAGSGLIAIDAAKKGAVVTATDINPIATEYIERNSLANDVHLTVITSDLFTNIPVQEFDIIVINPPYYFGEPVSWKDHAWYCGKNGGYFHSLFNHISNYTHGNTVILMVLCDGTDMDAIRSIAAQSGFVFDCVKEVQNLIEKNYVFRIKHREGKDEKDIIVQSKKQ